jgi:uncharacterized protein (DUF1330 family)
LPAYAIVNIAAVTDQEGFAEYRRLVPENVELHGGRYLVAGGEMDVVEGGWHPNRVVILEFPSYGQLKEWYESDDYRPLRDLRQGSSEADIVLVDGLAG